MTTPNKVQTIGEVAAERAAEIRRMQQHPEHYRPIPLDIAEIDSIVGGIKMPSYVAIGGRAKVGKSIVGGHIAAQIAESGRTIFEEGVPTIDQNPVLTIAFHLEEVRQQYADRMMTMRTQTATRTMIRDLTLTEDQLEELDDAAKSISLLPLEVDDSVFMADQMIAIALERKAQIIIVDTFNLLQDRTGGGNDSDRLAAISRKFIEARNKHGLTIIIIYQLNDDNKALGSRSVYRDCDLIIEVEPVIDEVTKETTDGMLKLNVMPSRQAQGGASVNVLCSPAHSRIIPSKTNTFKFGNMETLLDEIAT